MERSSVIKHFLALASGVVVMLWTLYLIVSPIKFALGFALLLITFVAGELLLSSGDVRAGKTSSYAMKRGHSLVEVLIVVTYLVSLVTIFLVPPIEGEFWLWWPDLAREHAFNLIRLAAAFGFNFFPGYVILTVAGKREDFQGVLPKLVTSFLLSLFMLTIIGFISAYLRGVIDGFFLNAFLSVNVVIIVAYFLRRVFRWYRAPVNSEFPPYAIRSFKPKLSALLVLLAVGFVGLWMLGPYSKIDFFIGGPGTDMWRHHGFAQSFLDGRAFAWLQVPWWFYLYLATFTVISGVPSANAYFTLYPLLSIFILSFYVMVSSFLKDKRVAAVATLAYAVFSGPAWIFALYLRDVVNPPLTWIGILYRTGDKFLYQGWYPPFVIGFNAATVAIAALWWLVYASNRLNLQRRFNFFLMSSIWTLSYLLHVFDGLAFILFLGSLLVINLISHDPEGKKRIRLASVSVLVALAFVTICELSLTGYYFTYTSYFAPARRYYYFNSPSFYAAVVSSVLIIILTYARMPKSMRNNLVSKYRSLKSRFPSWVNERLVVEAIFYLYGISLILWFILFEGFHVTQLSVAQVPWYIYPVYLGVPFLLGLVGACYLLLKWRKLEKGIKNALTFGVLSSMLLFILGQGASFVNLNFFATAFGERRILTYMPAMIGMLGSFALFEIFKRILQRRSFALKNLRKVAVSSLLISLVVIAGVSSTLIAVDFSSEVFFAEKITEEERQALTYLYYSLPRGYIAYIAKSSGTGYIRAFANDKWWDDPGLWIGAEWTLGWKGWAPENVLSQMKRTNVAYIYLHRTRDSQVLQKSLLLQLLLSVLPVAFNNSEVTIYSVPPSIRAPTSDASELGIVKPSESSGQAYDAYVLSLFTVALSGVSYKILNSISDPGIESVSNTVLLPYDPVPDEEDASGVFDWVDRGGDLVVFNTNSFGTFEDWFGLRPKRILESCDSDFGWSRWAERGSISIETTKKVEGNASLRLNFENALSYQWSGWTYNVTQAEGKSWNLDEWDTIGIWIYSNGTSGPQWYLKLYDVNARTGQFGDPQFLSQWDGTEWIPSFDGWKRILIPIEGYYGRLDLANITRLEISTGFQLPVDIVVDEIVVYRNITGKTYAANGIVGKQNIDLPTVTVLSLDIGGTIGVIANYTLNGLPVVPFAIEKDSGAGKVSFVNILPVNDFVVSNAGKVDVYDTLDKIHQMLQIIPEK